MALEKMREERRKLLEAIEANKRQFDVD